MTDYGCPAANNDATYNYGAAGLRVQKTVGGSTTTKYYQDGLNVVAEYNGSDQLQRTYVTPGLDQNLSLTASGSTYYYVTDALGSIRQLLDSDHATQNSYDYEAFGKVYGNPTENVTQPFRFTGREWDGETGLYYYRARAYEAGAGRFGRRDPALHVDAPNAYRYVGGNPVRLGDPTGMVEETVQQARMYPNGAGWNSAKGPEYTVEARVGETTPDGKPCCTKLEVWYTYEWRHFQLWDYYTYSYDGATLVEFGGVIMVAGGTVAAFGAVNDMTAIGILDDVFTVGGGSVAFLIGAGDWALGHAVGLLDAFLNGPLPPPAWVFAGDYWEWRNVQWHYRDPDPANVFPCTGNETLGEAKEHGSRSLLPGKDWPSDAATTGTGRGTGPQ